MTDYSHFNTILEQLGKLQGVGLASVVVVKSVTRLFPITLHIQADVFLIPPTSSLLSHPSLFVLPFSSHSSPFFHLAFSYISCSPLSWYLSSSVTVSFHFMYLLKFNHVLIFLFAKIEQEGAIYIAERL